MRLTISIPIPSFCEASTFSASQPPLRSRENFLYQEKSKAANDYSFGECILREVDVYQAVELANLAGVGERNAHD